MRVTLTLALLVGLSLTACSAPPTAAPTPSGAPITATATESSTPTPTVAPTPDPAQFTAMDPALFSLAGGAGDSVGGWDSVDVNFMSPSGNLGCAILGPEHKYLWGCVIAEKNWTFESDTPDDYCFDAQTSCGWGIEVDGDELPHPRYRGDPGFPGGIQVYNPGMGVIRALQYGEMVTFGNVSCFSQDTGVTCENAVSGHGFVISRALNEIY